MGFFNIHSVAKHQKFEGGKFLLSEKNLTMPKKTEKGTLWDSSTSILSQNSKKIEGGPIGKTFFPEKSLAWPNKNERGSRPQWYVTRENRKNLSGPVRKTK